MTTREQLDRLLGRIPFRPFGIELTSGRLIPVTTESQVFSPRAHPHWIFVFNDSISYEFELEAIQLLIDPLADSTK